MPDTAVERLEAARCIVERCVNAVLASEYNPAVQGFEQRQANKKAAINRAESELGALLEASHLRQRGSVGREEVPQSLQEVRYALNAYNGAVKAAEGFTSGKYVSNRSLSERALRDRLWDAREEIGAIVRAALVTTPAGGEGEHGDRFWLVLHEPGRVPELKGSWPQSEARSIIREFMRERPTAYIDYLYLDYNGPVVEHAPEWLQMLDGRSMAFAAKHNERTRGAHAEHHAALAAPASPLGEGPKCWACNGTGEYPEGYNCAACHAPLGEGVVEALDLAELDRLFALLPEGPWLPIHHTGGWEVRQVDTDPGNKHHWPTRLCQNIEGQIAGFDPAAPDFIAAVLNIWPSIRTILARVEGDLGKEGNGSRAVPCQESNLPDDVVRLVIAARKVAFDDYGVSELRELDAASEAFASRVPWENDPNDEINEDGSAGASGSGEEVSPAAAQHSAGGAK